ncbi:ribonuclease toxin immunity protein CdiI [Priestia filamentosa]|uniref:ribonuclease toxin immunity protein CdiI n=1 Tax=Priestia filamentosa TaxID=1402861 RepID=UPI0002E53FD9|nr:ribonuclease toxin immunity protein CdiI [Priestia filamentosa]UOE58291.1 hypothetical protein HPB58_13090 [Priestia filamentosa]
MNTISEDSKRFNQMYREKGLNKGVVIDVLRTYVIWYNFVKILDSFFKENVPRRQYSGVIHSDAFDPDDEGYFGENNVLFYYCIGEDDFEDIVTYEELCSYLEVASEFYMTKYPEQTNEIRHYLSKIKEKYNVT